MNTAPEYHRRTGICLNMIVKNETPVLGRLFQSLRTVIDYYVIVDTGSTDGTPEFITNWMAEAGIPGEVHRHEWVNFGFNRDHAFQLAAKAGKGDWVLMIDADEELRVADPLFHRRLISGVTYELHKHLGDTRYALPNLVDVTKNQWRWRAPVHEFLEHCAGPNLRQPLEGVSILIHSGEGARSRGKTPEQKFLADAALLEEELKRNPEDPRSRFYLAQSYRDAGHPDKARGNYLLRAKMTNGWVEEAFFAQYEAGRMARWLKLPHETVLADLLEAYNCRPTRAEPLHELAHYCREHQRWGEAFLFASTGAQLPKPNDRLFVRFDIYEWRMLDELSVSAYWAGLYAASRDAAMTLLKRHESGGAKVPENDLDRIRKNLRFAEDKLGIAK